MGEREVIDVLGGAALLGRGVGARLGLADAIVRGLPRGALERVKQAMGLTDREVAATVGLSQKTIGRLRKARRASLGPVVGDRLYRLAAVFSMAERVLESAEAAREWLRSPQTGLNRRVPLGLLATEAGAREVEDLLGRIEHGVLS
jgi:putative toxin-antitoxin system antitoxin component (TIGR02293 family)